MIIAHNIARIGFRKALEATQLAYCKQKMDISAAEASGPTVIHLFWIGPCTTRLV